MEQLEDKYKNDKYDRLLYIPKGYILPDGSKLTKSYARFHEDMAKRFIEENYRYTFANDRFYANASWCITSNVMWFTNIIAL